MSAKPQIIEHIAKPLSLTIYDVKWIPYTAKFVLVGAHARGTGAIQIYEMEHGTLECVKETEKPNSFKCGHFGASLTDEQHLATGDFKGRLNIWDLEDLSVPIYDVAAHKEIINCIDGIGGQVGKGAPEIVTGSRDGCVHVWDPRQKDKPVSSLVPGEGETARDCWAVGFGNAYNESERSVLAGYDNGDVKMLDLRTNSLVWETNVKNGVVSVEFDRRDINMNKFIVTALESSFAVYDARTQHPEEGFAHVTETAHKSTVWLGRHLPQNRDVFMTCGGNGSLNLYKYCYPSQRSIADPEGKMKGVPGTLERLATTTLSTQPIASFDWHPQKEGLCVMGAFDQTVRVGLVTKLSTV
eukprot:TRINITY_DN94_c0_g1_i15.p1 TRINITY_DN94_c0_g1~~TRINITY_DN94_c0_g1_i15.p1  ORF type:complete len:355 (-),score=68.34 TRINITY_DN94_c0_g1_i15:694-1758(-)